MTKKNDELALTLHPESGKKIFAAAQSQILQERTREVVGEVSDRMRRIEKLREVIARSTAAIDFYSRQLIAIQSNQIHIEVDYRGKTLIMYNESVLNGPGPEHGA